MSPDGSSPSASRRERYARDIRAEQVRSVYLHSPTTTIGSLVAGAVLVAAMWNQVDRPVLIGWLIALCLHQAVRVYHYRSYISAPDAERTDDRWGRLYTLAAGIAGVIWGSAGVLMYVPDSITYQTILALILYGIATVSMTSLSAFAPAFYLLIPLTLVPFLIRQAIEVDLEHAWLLAPGLIVLLVALAFGRNVNRVIAEAIQKRFENLDLIEQLSQQKAVAEAARLDAETANRSKTQFFAAASHDLRQPLHAIGLFASALNEKVTEPEAKQLVGSVNQSVHALESLFNELLDISKIDSGVIKPALRDFALQSVLDRLRGDFAAEAAAKGLAFRISAPDATVRSDPVLLERILRNLVANALRYTDKGEVAVHAGLDGNLLRIEVRDTGIGIPEADQQRIFEEFTQLQNPARTSRMGLGLGLSIVKRLCDLLGCAISVSSQPGRGSIFGFGVPLGVAAAATVAQPQAPAAARADLSGRLVVVVDDEEAIVAGMQALLSSWGAEVIGSLSGDDVVGRVHDAGRLPDLLIVDYRLGGGDTGIDVAQRLRRDLDPEIPAVLVTGSITPDLEEKARSADLGFLLKPVNPHTLRALIDEKLGGTGR